MWRLRGILGVELLGENKLFFKVLKHEGGLQSMKFTLKQKVDPCIDMKKAVR